MRKSIVFLITLIFCVCQAQASVIYVNLNATGNNSGASWSNGYTDFQAAVDAAIAGDSIFVATAVYQPASGAGFVMKEGVKIFGGFTGTESSFSQRSLKNKATLKGNGNSVVSNDDNGLTSAAELDGFIITGGTADQGGGIYNNKVSPVIRNCIFENNSANINGGGMFNASSSANIINCIFTGNTTAGNGGGLFNYTNAKVHIINCIIWGNNSDNSGGGIYNRLANPVITNTIIWNNMAALGDNGLFNNNGNPVISYCNTQDQVLSGAGNISQDPLFTDPANGDFSLQNLSPCINTGNSAANNSAVDLAGNPRIMGTSIDMGAIERSPVKYVNLNATGNNSGASWTNAYTDFQAAVDAAIAGDSIFVATAVYQPAAGASFVMKEGVKIFGGFTGTESSLSQRSLKNKATLKGNGNSVVSNDDNGLTSAAELDGFIITGGTADQGGGIYNNNVSPLIRNCIFENNTAGNGGGMYNGLSSSAIINCIFSGNAANGRGGGLYLGSSISPIINCTIWGNHALFGGGGVNIIVSKPVITNTVVWNNTSTQGDNGVYNQYSARPVISYCNIQDQVLSGAGNISQDPLFTDPANGDFSLQNFSPCINTGNSAANSSGVDLAGNPRIMGPSIDMGAIERSPVKYVKLDATGNNDGSSWGNAYTDLEAAIDAAIAGDSIFVATAVYQPAAGTSFGMREGVKIFGGFAGTESSFSQRNLINKATLKGNGGSVIINNHSHLTAAAVLDGFIITGGRNAAYGGGIFNSYVSPVIRNCIIENNSAQFDGGGIFNGGSATPSIVNCIVSANTSGSYGAGIANEQSNAYIINSTICGNNTAGSGGGIFNNQANPVITNTIVWNNTSTDAGGGIFNANGGMPVVSYSNIQDQVLSGAGNISQDPLFTDPANGIFSLQSTSPLIDAGTPDTTGLLIGNTDIAGAKRIAGAAIDMGAYEHSDIPLPVTLITFTGKLQNRTARLQWKTGVEDKLHYFEIQKGLGGENFTTIFTVQAKGDNSDYSVNAAQTEASAGYRLKMVDKSGKVQYSKVIWLSQNAADKLFAYPNPAKSYIKINMQHPEMVRIFNATGKLVKAVQLEAGINQIYISDLASGLYFIIAGDNRVSFLKQ